MKKSLFVIFLFASLQLFAGLNLQWSHKYFGKINGMIFSDIDADSLNELVVVSDNGVFALDGGGKIVWDINKPLNVGKIIPFQYDDDMQSEFAATGWLEGLIIDNDGNVLKEDLMVDGASTYNLPLAVIGNKAISWYSSYDNSGLSYIGSYGDVFYAMNYVYTTTLDSIDTNGDGKNDILFVANQTNTFAALDSDGNELWKMQIDNSDTNVQSIKSYKRDDGKIVIAVGMRDGTLYEYDQNGTKLWALKLEKPVQQIIKDANGGILTINNDYMYGSMTADLVYKIDDISPAILWYKSTSTDLTKAVDTTSGKIAASFGSTVRIFDENGLKLQEKKIANVPYGYDFRINSLKFSPKNRLYIGSMDIDILNDDNTTIRFFTGGSLVYNIHAGDMNMDGKDEIAVQDENRVIVYAPDGKFLWEKDKYTLFKRVGFCDLNGDGKDELLSLYGGKVVCLGENGKILWQSDTVYYSNIYPTVILYDYDGDGLKDLFTSGLNQTTQMYDIKVWSGKDGTLLHDFGSVRGHTYLLPLDIRDDKRLYFMDSYVNYYMEFNESVAYKKNSPIFVSINKYLDNYVDVTKDGVVDAVIGTQEYDNVLHIGTYDLTIDNTNDSLLYTVNIDTKEYAKEIKLLDYNGDGSYEYLVVFPSKLALYGKDGKEIWHYDTVDQFGEGRNLSRAEIYGDYIVASGKIVYIFDKNGNKLQTIDQGIYGSGYDYYMPFAIYKDQNDMISLAVGSMGVYSYGSIEPDFAYSGKISYKKGWNLVSTPIKKSISLDDISGILLAWRYEDGKWSVYTTNESDNKAASDMNLSRFDAIDPGEGVWIKCDRSNEIELKGDKNHLPALKTGWNLVGGVDISTDNIKNAYPTTDIVWKYVDGEWKGKSYIDNISLDNLQDIYSNEGFWVRVK